MDRKDGGKERCHIAFDCGNSSIRVVAGIFDGSSIRMHLVQQVPNETVEVNGFAYWDILYIFDRLKKGLKKAYQEFGVIDSVGISTWGIDFGLIGPSGQLLGNPLCYRNPLGPEMLGRLSEEQREELFLETGIPEHPMNTIYQLLGVREFFPEILKSARTMLLIPELLAWLFTGTMRGESSIGSTTQMMDMRTKTWSAGVLDRFGIDRSLFPEPLPHGQSYGRLRESIARELGMEPCEFLCVPGHDTASAVVSVPAGGGEFLFISSGTWSLIGSEVRRPVMDKRVRELGFANEGGVFDTITLLKNSAGMHILQNIKNELEDKAGALGWEDLIGMAERHAGNVPVFDPNDAAFYNPPKMADAINDYVRRVCSRSGGLSDRELAASAYTSLACSYRKAVEDLENLTGRLYGAIHIVGGGCRNDFLNRMTAEMTGKEVIAGPDEATSFGNIGIQILGREKNMDLTGIRRVIADSQSVKRFKPREGGRSAPSNTAAYNEYLKRVQRG